MFDNIISDLATMSKTHPELSELHESLCLSTLHKHICDFLLHDLESPVIVTHIKDTHKVEVKQNDIIKSESCDFDFTMDKLKSRFTISKLNFKMLSDESMIISFK